MSVLKFKDANNSWITVPAGGVGVPSGGTQGQVLVKTGSADYATGWETRKATVFQLGTGDSNVTSFGTGIYDPNNSTVRIYLVARSTSDMGFSTILATVPDEYKPSADVNLYGTMKVNDLPFCYIGKITSYGNIFQLLNASARDVFLCGEYVI